MRSALIETLGEDYIRTARAKGLTRAARRSVRHALRNALIPVLTILGLQFSFLLAGAIIIENVFYLPGLGRLVFQAITQRDLIVVESVVMLLVFAVILVTFLVDLAYAAVDPRLRRRAVRRAASPIGGRAGRPSALLAALVSLFWTPYDVTALDIAAKLQPPSAAHWFGTDHFGRDIALDADGRRAHLDRGGPGRGRHRHGRSACRSACSPPPRRGSLLDEVDHARQRPRSSPSRRCSSPS